MAAGWVVVVGVVAFVAGFVLDRWIMRSAEKAWRAAGEADRAELTEMALRARLLDAELEEERAKVRRLEAERPAGDPPWVRELMTRLLDAALPAPREPGGDGEGRPPTPPEYEPPPPQVSDWTDPFFGMTRDVVGGLRPGEGIPGIGGDEIVSDGMVATDAGWVPGDDDIARWQDVGEEVGEQWLDQTTPPR